MKVKFIFAWYDFWVGFYWDIDERCLYFFPVPCFGIKFIFKPKVNIVLCEKCYCVRDGNSAAGCPTCDEYGL